MTSDNFAQCVEHINVLTLRLKNADERCSLLSANLRRVKAECASQHSSSVPPPPPLLLTTMMKGGAGSISGSMSLPTAGSVTPPVLQKKQNLLEHLTHLGYFLNTPLHFFPSCQHGFPSSCFFLSNKKVRLFQMDLVKKTTHSKSSNT